MAFNCISGRHMNTFSLFSQNKLEETISKTKKIEGINVLKKKFGSGCKQEVRQKTKML